MAFCVARWFDLAPSRLVRRVIVGGGLLFAICSASVAQAQITAQAVLEPIVAEFGPKYQDVDTAIEHLRSNKVPEAMQSLKTARQKNADLPPAATMMAMIMFRLNQLPTAQQALEEAVREDAQDPGAYVYMAELAMQGRRWAEARLLFDKGMALIEGYSTNPKRKNQLLSACYSGMTTLAELTEDWQTAKDLLTKQLEVDPTSSVAMTRLGRVMFKLSTDRDAENEVYAIFKKLHTQDENTAYPDVNMALLYDSSGKRNNAKAMMERAVQKDGKNIRTLLAAAKWALDTGNLEMAKAQTDAAMKLDAESLDALLYAGLVARFNNDLATAERVLKEAHLLNPSHLGVSTNLALVLVEQADEKKRAQARAYAELNARAYSDLNDPSGREAGITYAWVLSRLGQNAVAARNVQEVLKVGSSISADSAYHSAQILYDSGLTELAQKILEPTLKSEAVFPSRAKAEQLLAKIANR